MKYVHPFLKPFDTFVQNIMIREGQTSIQLNKYLLVSNNLHQHRIFLAHISIQYLPPTIAVSVTSLTMTLLALPETLVSHNRTVF